VVRATSACENNVTWCTNCPYLISTFLWMTHYIHRVLYYILYENVHVYDLSVSCVTFLSSWHLEIVCLGFFFRYIGIDGFESCQRLQFFLVPVVYFLYCLYFTICNSMCNCKKRCYNLKNLLGSPPSKPFFLGFEPVYTNICLV
jgi:hypothetical protein